MRSRRSCGCSSRPCWCRRSQLLTLPKASPDGLVEVALSDQVALVIHRNGQLGEGAGSRTEDDLRVVREVEGRLVARAQHVVGGALVEGDRATHVGADLR